MIRPARLLLPALFLIVAASLPAAEQSEKQRGNDPLSPAEALERFVLSPELDLRIDLVACEPDVVDPIALAFDEHGWMYVVEMRDYPTLPEGQKPNGRIRLLQDTDGDGRFETSYTFAKGLLFPTGILPWKGGLIVTLAGEVRYFRDTDGDHQADVSQVWFRGFAERNTQLRANHPTLGPDGWIYIANGLRGGTVKTVRPDWPQQTLELRGGDLRFNPRTGEAEVIAGGSQFGLTFDAWGNRFRCSNRNPGDQIVLERSDLERAPAAAIGSPIQVVCAAGNDSHVYPLTEAWTTSTLHAGQFTAACGVLVYTGDALPSACVGNVFTCEPTGSLVHRAVLTPHGGTFTAQPGEHEASFLASTDSWFRPVNLSIGPDGALYVVDMYRAVIEHPRWMPSELKDRRDMRWGREQGRIYRIAATDNSPGPMPTLDGADTKVLLAALKDANGWMRDTAARLLLERPEPLDAEILINLAQSADLPQTRLRAVQLALAQPGGGSSRMLLIGLKDEDPRVVAGSVDQLARALTSGALSEKFDDKGLAKIHKRSMTNIRELLPKLAGAEDARVRFEVARTLGLVPPAPDITHALADIVLQDAELKWTRAAVLTATRRPLDLYDAIVRDESPTQGTAMPFLVELAEMIGRRGKAEETTGLLERLATTGPESGWATPILQGLGRGMGGSLAAALAQLDSHTRGRFDALFSWAASVAADPDAPTGQRRELIQLIALAGRSFALPTLLELTDLDRADLRAVVYNALGRFHNDKRIAPSLLDDFQQQPPEVRSAALAAILEDPARARVLLDAISDGDLAVAALNPTQIRALRKHHDKGIRALASKLFAPPADRQAVIKAYQSAATMNADSRAGRQVFKKNCAICHQIGDLGTQVGPDIADSRTRSPQALLTDILNPNRAIDGQYMSYSVLLATGKVETGIILGETNETLTLGQEKGKTLTINRDDIEAVHSDGTSLMPVGIERTITPEEMANLISFIKNWRYLDGDIPLGKAEQ